MTNGEGTPSPQGETTTPSAASKRPRSTSRSAGRGVEAFRVSSFARLARSHACSAAGDALFAIALADSLFFSINPNDARWQLALYLLVTVAPFGFVAPWLGPAMDRLQGGHRYMLIGSAAIRSILALAVARYIGSFGLFPLAFSMLVMGKAHHVAKSALVPGIVQTDEGLVKANSRLSIISAISAGVIGIPGVLLLRFSGPEAVMGLAVVVFLVGALLGSRIPATRVASAPANRQEKAELRGAGVVLAASAMGYVRGVTGFLTMLLAFELRGGVDPGPIGTGVELGHRIREALGASRLDLATGGAPKWHFGLVLAMLGLGGLGGAAASPRLRKVMSEERILACVLGAMGLVGVLSAIIGGLVGAMMIAFVMAIAGQAGKQSFDAIVQRDAPKANLGRSFSRFESRFQLFWVFGALIPVVVPLPARIGFAVVAGASSFAAISYWFGRNPAPSTEKPRAGLLSLVRKLRGSSEPEGAGATEEAAAQATRQDSDIGATPSAGVVAGSTTLTQTQALTPTKTPSIFDLPVDADADFANNFDFGPTDSDLANDAGYEPTSRYELTPEEPPVSPPLASPAAPPRRPERPSSPSQDPTIEQRPED